MTYALRSSPVDDHTRRPSEGKDTTVWPTAEKERMFQLWKSAADCLQVVPLVAAVEKIVMMQGFDVQKAFVVLADSRCCVPGVYIVSLRADFGLDNLAAFVNPDLRGELAVARADLGLQRLYHVVAESLEGDLVLGVLNKGTVLSRAQHASGNASGRYVPSLHHQRQDANTDVFQREIHCKIEIQANIETRLLS